MGVYSQSFLFKVFIIMFFYIMFLYFLIKCLGVDKRATLFLYLGIIMLFAEWKNKKVTRNKEPTH